MWQFVYSLKRAACLAVAGLVLNMHPLHADHHQGPDGRATTHDPHQIIAPVLSAGVPLPPVPPGVTELRFNDFFKMPVGPRGLELTDKLKQCDGKRVRLTGFMARQEHPSPETFLLTPLPAHRATDNCLVDDVPPCRVDVLVPYYQGQVVPFTPKLMVLTGTLSLGNRTEPDGRVSIIRLTLDPPEPETQPVPTLIREP